MKPKLKPIAEQVMVITGATSGIGLATAQLAAKRGAKLVLVARNADALEKISDNLRAGGAQVSWVAADVANDSELRTAVTKASENFGAIDTWVNNAGVSIFGYNEQVTLGDHRRLFETNFWGTVNGSLIAIEQLRSRGGALINLGSELSDVSAPLQGMYAASKHAVKGFTDSLRMEVEHDGAPVSITLIKPAAIDTLFVEHAKNYMDVEPKLPAPIYAPELVAEAIISAAQYPQRDIFVGGAAKIMSVGARIAPRWFDKMMERFMFNQQRTEKPETNPQHNSLHQASDDLRVRGNNMGPVFESCLYTKAALNPKKTLAITGSALATGAVLFSYYNRRKINPVARVMR
jgi:short-subunit dehydrogenase